MIWIISYKSCLNCNDLHFFMHKYWQNRLYNHTLTKQTKWHYYKGEAIDIVQNCFSFQCNFLFVPVPLKHFLTATLLLYPWSLFSVKINLIQQLDLVKISSAKIFEINTLWNMYKQRWPIRTFRKILLIMLMNLFSKLVLYV